MKSIFTAVICLSAGLVNAQTTDSAQPTKLTLPPVPKAKNVLFIFADDLGYKDIGCFGSSFYETPHLDALRKDSLKLTNAYAACPVCSPTRSSVMTGQYPARTKNTDYFGAYNHKPNGKVPKRYQKRAVLPASYIDQLPHKLTTVAESLKKRGFSTFFAGKWHLGGKGSWPQDHGFDINKGGWTRGGPYGGKRYFSPYGNPQLEDGPDGEHLPDRLATETVKFIKEADKPFFAMLSFYSVHTPLIGREDLVEKYKKKAQKLGLTKKDCFQPEFPRQVRVKQNHAIYGAMVEAMDESIGKLIKGLKDSGKYEDTMIIFFSDNGGLSTSEGSPTSNQPFRAGKGWLYEGGIKEPALLKIPGITKPNSTSGLIVTSTDFYPTILEACGISRSPKHHIDGKSIITRLETPDQRPIFWHYPHWGNQGGTPGSAIRKGDWKLIQFYDSKGYELYNLKQDAGEQKNLAKTNPKKLEELKKLLDNWKAETKANPVHKNPHFKEEHKKLKW